MATIDSAKDGWVLLSAIGKGNTFVEHWTGASWQRVTVSTAAANFVGGATAIAASSASNVWVFGGPGKVLRRIGTTWTMQSIPSWVVHFNEAGDVDVSAAVFSTTDVWVFSLGQDALTNPDHYAAYYNGNTWTKVQLPAVPCAASAPSPADIWVLSCPGNTPQVLMHRTASGRWQTVKLPALPSGLNNYYQEASALGPKDVWVVPINITSGPLYLLHWNGSAFSRASLKFPSTLIGGIKSDGSGGIWMWANGPAPASQWLFYHLHGSQWREYPAPLPSNESIIGNPNSGVIQIEWIPGANAVWATADGTTSSTGPVSGLILKGSV